MNIILDINDFNIDNVFFQESIKNTIILNSKFNRTIYSNEFCTLNIIFIKFCINVLSKDKFFNKYKCYYNINNNKDSIRKLIEIENNIINKFNINKTKSLKITEQLVSGFIKIINTNNDAIDFSKIDNTNNFEIILKISGIWETESEYGLTYKFIV